MKKKNRIQVRVFVIMGLVLMFNNSCRKGSDPVNGGNIEIAIKGVIGTTKSSNSGNALSLADAKKVLVFSKYYYSLTNIVNGAFSVSGQVGTGVALIFLDADNHYIGNLSSRGLNVLPLGNLKEGNNTSIDLSTLTMVDNYVIPAHDPFGNEINITEAEISCLQKLGGYYESIAKNIDADNDGIPDVLTNSQLVLCTEYGIYGGHWGLNNTFPVISDSTHYYVNYGIEFGGGSALTFSNGNITLAGPDNSPYSDIIKWGYMMAPQCGADRGFIASFNRQTNAPKDAPWGSTFLPFKDGTYTLTLDGEKSYTLNYSCVDVRFNLVIVVPTLYTNSDGKLTSVNFEYKLPKGTPINPASILNNVMIQLYDKNMAVFYGNYGKKLNAETSFDVLTTDTPVDISQLYGINIEYDDLLGNHYSIVWR
jgi:hypothetical protein